MKNKVGILDFYVGRSIFITGATGFMGKVLVEKLLRSCPGIDRVYLLIRHKIDKDVRFRLQEMIKCKVFEWLRQNQPDALKKLIPISGDVTLPNLGISLCELQELEILNKVSVVFHLAICTTTEDDVRCAIDSNVKGTKQVAVFSRQMKDLKAFVHVSTTYNNVEKDTIEEEVYPTSLDPQKLMDLIDCMDDKLLASINKQLVGKYPNVCSYTQALSEQLLKKMSECSEPRFPAVIVRFSTITAALQEPLPGWVANFNGPNGFVAGVSKGIIQIARINAQLIADMIPVDLSVNLLIAAAWDVGICAESTSSIRVYNCSSGSLNPIRWCEWKRLAIRAADKFPCEEIVRCPSVVLRANNRLVFVIEFVLFHLLPAFFIDIVAMVNGIEPFLTRLCKKTRKMMSRLEFYTLREWNFVSRNPAQLMDKMSLQEKNTFNFNVRQINWEKYMDAYVFGVRTHLFKDDLCTVPDAKNHLKQMKKIKMLIRLRFIGVIFFFFYLFLSNFVCTPNSNISPDICSVIHPSNSSVTVQNSTAEIFSYTNRTIFSKSF